MTEGPAPDGLASKGLGREDLARDGLADRLRSALGLEALEVTPEGDEGEIAVVRVPPEQLPRLLEGPTRERIVTAAREAGFRYAAVDLAFPGAEPAPRGDGSADDGPSGAASGPAAG